MFYELAMSIGKSLDMDEMLRQAIFSYIQKLNCSAAMVFRSDSGGGEGRSPHLIFSLPDNFEFAEQYPLVVTFFKSQRGQEFIQQGSKRFPYQAETDKGEHILIMPLGTFGYLVLVRNKLPLELSVINNLSEVNEKLAQSCQACENNQSLEESEKNFRTFFETINDPIFIGNEEGQLFYTNPAVEKKLGYTPKDLSTRDIFDMHPENRREETIRHLTELFSGNRTACSIPLRTKNGNHIPVESRVWKGRWNGEECFFCISKDLTRQQEALLKFDKMFNSNPALMAVAELDGKQPFTEVNQAFLEALGYTREEVLGKSPLELNLYRSSPVSAEILHRLRTEGQAMNMEVRVFRKSGEPLEGIFSGEVIESNGKKYILTVITDISKRKMAERKVLNTRNRLDYIIRGTNVGTWEWNVQTGETIFNELWANIIGYSLDELQPVSIKTWQKYCHPEDLKKSAELLEKHFRGETDFYDCELRMRHKDGRWIWVHDRGGVVSRTEDGKPLMMYGTHQEIDSRKRAEAELKQSRQQLSDILNNLNDVIWSASYPDMNLIYVSPSVEKTLELNPSDFKAGQKEWLKLVHPDDRKIAQNDLKKLEKTGSSFSEYRIITPEGKQKWIQSQNSVIRDDEGNPLRIDGSIKDITGQKEFQKTLEMLVDMAKTFINMPVENLSVEIYKALKLMGEYVEADRVYIFDYDFRKGTTSNTYEWCREGIPPEIENLQDVPMEAIPQWVETHKKGDEMYIPDVLKLPKGEGLRDILEPQGIKSLLTLPMIDKEELIGFVGFDSVRNHHEYTQSERSILTVFIELLVNVQGRLRSLLQLSEAKEAAEEANKAKSEFLANMSHEIRTPMNAILGFSESLYHKLKVPANKKLVNSVLSSGNLLLSLLNDILDLSKIEAGKLELETQPVYLNSIIDDVKILYQDKAREKGLELSVLKDSEVPEILMLDEVRMKQIIFNLVGNAVKFTHEGFVQIGVSYSKPASGVPELTVKISDSGIGVPEGQQEIIFEAFRQQFGQSTRAYGGAGLGLAISRRLAHKMGGSIRLESEVGKGSVFCLTLPVAEVDEKDLPFSMISDKNEQVIFHGSELLVVDDVPSNIEALESLLESSNLRIHGCESGEEALKYLETRRPDLILMDIRMAGMNGYETAEQIRKDPDKKDLPIIALTAALPGKTNSHLNRNFNRMLFKPFKRSDLLQELKKYLKHTLVPGNEPSEPEVPEFLRPLTKEEKKLLPGAVSELKSSFLPRWEGIRNTLDLIRINAFADDLEALGKNTRIEPLCQYARELKENTETIDLEAMQKNLLRFREIIDNYEKQ